jgi:hypothetical protein
MNTAGNPGTPRRLFGVARLRGIQRCHEKLKPPYDQIMSPFPAW